ncbi:MAG TPA: methyl-accepting chemotaxis protein [Gemmatimonadaceae bacterium]|nr:methyl-accepting chemotaxis protein [Gemmatimonadaceae bacterium]
MTTAARPRAREEAARYAPSRSPAAPPPPPPHEPSTAARPLAQLPGLGTLSLLEEGYRATDRFLVRLLWAHVGLALALAPLRDTWLPAIIIATLATGGSALAARLAPGKAVTRFIVAVAFMTYSGLIIHQTGGMIEMHFHVFGALAFLLMYRDWRAPVVAAGAIAVHHAVANILQSSGYPIYVFQDHLGHHIVAVHAAWVIFETSILIYFARQLAAQTRQAESLMRVAMSLGEGDLSARAQLIEGKDGVVSRAATAINSGAERLADSIGRVQRGARRAVDLSDTTRQATDVAADAGRHAIEAASRVAESARRQLDGTHSLATVVNDLISSVDQMSTTASQVGEVSREAAGVARRGAEAVEATVAGMARVHEKVRESTVHVREMETHSQQIGSIVTVIRGIANQTKLLALNAAIEAARAGEQGRGFAVVAEEVRKLAVSAAQSVGEIDALIQQIQSSIQRVVEGMEQETAQTDEGTRLARGAGAALHDILRAVEQTTQDVEGIAMAAAEIAGRGTQGRSTAAASVDEIVTTATQNQHSAEDVLNSLKRLLAGVDQITDCTSELDRVSREVGDRVEVFTV